MWLRLSKKRVNFDVKYQRANAWREKEGEREKNQVEFQESFSLVVTPSYIVIRQLCKQYEAHSISDSSTLHNQKMKKPVEIHRTRDSSSEQIPAIVPLCFSVISNTPVISIFDSTHSGGSNFETVRYVDEMTYSL
jgi:hypothetical protein